MTTEAESNFLKILNDVFKEAEGPVVDGYTASRMLRDYNPLVECPFEIGDYVTPIKESMVKGCGEPHRVMQVFKQAQIQVYDMTKPLAVFNMIVSQVIHDKKINMYAALSTNYEPYKGVTCEEVDIDSGIVINAQ